MINKLIEFEELELKASGDDGWLDREAWFMSVCAYEEHLHLI